MSAFQSDRLQVSVSDRSVTRHQRVPVTLVPIMCKCGQPHSLRVSDSPYSKDTTSYLLMSFQTYSTLLHALNDTGMQADVFDIPSWRSQLEGTVGVVSCLGAFGSNDFMYKVRHSSLHSSPHNRTFRTFRL